METNPDFREVIRTSMQRVEALTPALPVTSNAMFEQVTLRLTIPRGDLDRLQMLFLEMVEAPDGLSLSDLCFIRNTLGQLTAVSS